ncbi:hypothetical protein GCM10027399_31920 [Curvibacter fontanus]
MLQFSATAICSTDIPGPLAMAVRQPAGVVLGIAAWNAPVILGTRAICVPLACGNTVVMKGSENCPRTHLLIIEAFQDAGFPSGVTTSPTPRPTRTSTSTTPSTARPLAVSPTAARSA